LTPPCLTGNPGGWGTLRLVAEKSSPQTIASILPIAIRVEYISLA
jgi:hypothetical protein